MSFLFLSVVFCLSCYILGENHEKLDILGVALKPLELLSKQGQ